LITSSNLLGSITGRSAGVAHVCPLCGQTADHVGQVRFVPISDICTAANNIFIRPPRRRSRALQDVGRKLLQSVGFAEPDDVSIRQAIALNDKFIDDLQAIHQRAQQTYA
jgi:hypothetical protein